MLKKTVVKIFGLLLFSILALPAVYADGLVVKGNYAFLADGDLKIYNIKNPSDSDPQTPFGLTGAVEVAISGSNAIVTVEKDGVKSIEIVDITSVLGNSSDDDSDDSNDDDCNCDCNSDGVNDNDIDPKKYIASFDSKKGEMTIEYCELNGKYYKAVMKQRGNSSNWELVSAEEVDPPTASDDTDD